MKLPKIKENLIVQELKDEVLIYEKTTNKYYCLNETAKIVFNACNGVKSLSDVKLPKELIYFTLDELKKQKLIEDDYVSPYAGMNRREVIRKVGSASLIALPIISFLVAPTSANAASGTATANQGAACGEFCSSGTQCRDGSCYGDSCQSLNGRYLGNNRLYCSFDSTCSDGSNICCNGSARVTSPQQSCSFNSQYISCLCN